LGTVVVATKLLPHFDYIATGAIIFLVITSTLQAYFQDYREC